MGQLEALYVPKADLDAAEVKLARVLGIVEEWERVVAELRRGGVAVVDDMAGAMEEACTALRYAIGRPR